MSYGEQRTWGVSGDSKWWEKQVTCSKTGSNAWEKEMVVEVAAGMVVRCQGNHGGRTRWVEEEEREKGQDGREDERFEEEEMESKNRINDTDEWYELSEMIMHERVKSESCESCRWCSVNHNTRYSLFPFFLIIIVFSLIFSLSLFLVCSLGLLSLSLSLSWPPLVSSFQQASGQAKQALVFISIGRIACLQGAIFSEWTCYQGLARWWGCAVGVEW